MVVEVWGCGGYGGVWLEGVIVEVWGECGSVGECRGCVGVWRRSGSRSMGGVWLEGEGNEKSMIGNEKLCEKCLRDV